MTGGRGARRVAWEGLRVALHDDVYEPGDDTYLLAAAVRDHVRPGDRFVEVGCGTGLVSLVAARAGAACVATDRNGIAAALAARNARENGVAVGVVRADLLAGLRGPFDVVAFNPPYLPTAEHEHLPGPLDWAFDGGPDGTAVVARFVEQLADLPRPREVLVVHSSIADTSGLDARMAALGFSCEVVVSRRFFYEAISVRRFR